MEERENFERLVQEHEALKKRLAEVNSDYSQTMKHLFAAQDVLRKEGLEVPGSISADRAKALLPSPFDEIVSGTTGTTAQYFDKLHDAKEDFDWGADMELQIRDFIITHEFGSFVELESVICRDSICEIRGFQDNQFYWSNKLRKDITKMPFWKFQSTSSQTGQVPREENGEDGAEITSMSNYFYVLTSLKV